ncbi:DUF2155 domain-containing protein [Aquicoccus sp. G2-2]|uniref:DUF2155 domain-containing protein n=1 Tax=Aquicoccus sp. G2-2 TaxID=3092120 RepID=UPI002ADF01E9|nr:DUF2155 domain-containing protein [Aquicoccus sp. G2-2]MEA1113257.1 DUF2155 domain-containing protein [Aquicoccus sp. G2-2]
MKPGAVLSLIGAILLWAAPVAESAAAEEVNVGKGAVLRALDKLTGEVRELDVMNGDVAKVGHLMIALGECRYPPSNPTGEAYAFLAIGDNTSPDPVFTGWMIASSPGLNAMDHRRYDVWVLRCIIE